MCKSKCDLFRTCFHLISDAGISFRFISSVTHCPRGEIAEGHEICKLRGFLHVTILEGGRVTLHGSGQHRSARAEVAKFGE